MQPKTSDNTADRRSQAGNWPIIDNVIVPIADWWRRHAAVRDSLDHLDAFGPDEMARLAQDVGISAGELRALASHCEDAARLLDRRVAALGLDARQLAHAAPAQFRDMERLCTLCASKGRCARDLAADPSDPVWRQYCPNQSTLSALAQAEAHS